MVGVLVLIILILAGCAVLLHSPRLKDSGRGHPLPVAARVEPAAAAVSPAGGKYCYAGEPVSRVPLLVLTNIGYVIGYDKVRRSPVWVGYRLFSTNNPNWPKRPDRGFPTDKKTKAFYKGYGTNYNRGHCAPSRAIGFCYGVKAQLETFQPENILPERPLLNQRVWEKLEAMELTNYARQCKEIWVTTGPVFDESPKTMPNGAVIPKSIYKIIADEEDGRVRVLAFIIPQTVQGREYPAQFLTSVDEVEKETGLDFMSELPDDVENRVEAEKAADLWRFDAGKYLRTGTGGR